MTGSEDMMNKKNKGFTLIELQVASFVSMVVLLAILTLYVFALRSFTTGDALLDVYANSRNAIGWMMKDIRCAKQVIASHGAYTTTDSSIVLMVPSIDSSGNVISPCYDYITYRLQGSDMYRIVEKDPASARLAENRIIAKYCSSLVFSSGGNTLSSIGNLSTINTVAIYLPLNKATISLAGGNIINQSITPTTTVRLRNK